MVVAVLAWAKGRDEPASGVPLTVEAVVAEPGKFTEPIVVEGFVNFVSEKEGVAVLASEDCSACGPKCGIDLLPVRWPGTLPRVSERVRVRGVVQRGQGGYQFAATAVLPAGAESDAR